MTVDDTVFGEMSYDVALWLKTEEIRMWGKDFETKIEVRAYDNAEISEVQRNSYLYLKSNIQTISEYTASLICDYVNENFEDLSLYWDKPKVYKSFNDFGDDIRLTAILFEEDGSIIFLCEVAWDVENGLGIKLNRVMDIGPQELFL